MISTYDFETLRYYNPRFGQVLRLFGVPNHIESVVCLSKEKVNE